MPKIEDEVLLDVVKKGEGLSTLEVIAETVYSPGSYGIIALRLGALAKEGKCRVEARKHANKKTQRFWWPV